MSKSMAMPINSIDNKTHEHDHQHDHCSCHGGHEHHHHHQHGAETETLVEKIYTIDNIDCANCAAKVEAKISQIPGVKEANLSFFTKQLKITAQDPDSLLDLMRKVADETEPGTTIMPRETVGLTEKITRSTISTVPTAPLKWKKPSARFPA